jgi:ABC-type transport system substrate-binding protein
MGDHKLILPKEAAIDGKFSEGKTLIGTGPFVVQEMKPGGLSKLVRNPDWFRAGPNKRPYLDAIEDHNLSAPAREAAMKTRQIDGGQFGAGAARPFLNDPNFRVFQGYGNLVGTSAVNMSINNPPTSDIRVRQAINLAMDREAFIAIVYEGLAYPPGPIGGYWQPWFWTEAKVRSLEGFGNGKRPPDPEYDKAKEADYTKAKALLKEAGFAGGLTITVEATTTGSDKELLVEQLARVGITVKIRTGGQPRSAEFMKDKQMNIESTGSLNTPDASIEQDFLCNGTQHPSGVCDQKIEAQWREYRRTFDVAKRVALLDQLQQYIWDLRIAAPFARSMGHGIFQKDVRGWRNPFNDAFYRPGQTENMWLDR